MARKKWKNLSKAEKKAFRDGDRSVGKKEYKAQRQAKRPVTVNKASSQKVKNVATKLTAAQAAGKKKQSQKLAGKLQEARGNQLRRSDIRQMVKESGGNIQAVNNQLKQKNLRSGAQKFLSKKLSAATNKPPTKITQPMEPKSPSVEISGGVNNVNNSSNVSVNTGTVPNEPPSRPDTAAGTVGNQLNSTSNQTSTYNGVNKITDSTVTGGVGNVDNSNNSSFFQGSQAFQMPKPPKLPEAESGATATPVSNVLETNKTQEANYNGENTITNSFIGGGVGNVNNADYSVTIQGGGPGGGLSNQGAVAAGKAMMENDYERSRSKLDGDTSSNNAIISAYGLTGVNDRISSTRAAVDRTRNYWRAKANQQRDLVMGNYLEVPTWKQPDALKPVESDVKDIYEDGMKAIKKF